MPLSHSETIDPRTFIYTVDAHDRIVAVNDAFIAFAVENDAPGLPATVLGTSLWRHFGDPTSRTLWQLLFRRARATGQSVRVPARCDAPAMTRVMELEAVPASDGGLELRSRIVAQRPRPAVALLDVTLARSRRLVRMCGWCKAIEVERAWLPPERALADAPILCQVPVPAITHGICGACEQAVLAQLDAADADDAVDVPAGSAGRLAQG